MKTLINPILTTIVSILLFMNANSQQPLKNYEAQWKSVEELNRKGLPQSALKQVKQIYTMAKKDGQEAQQIKCLIFFSSLQQANREDGSDSSISELEKELTAQKEPAASIIKSLIADIYFNYFQENRWKFYSRTNTTAFKKTDISTWTLDDLISRISELYLSSIKDAERLQQTSLQPYDAIIIKGNTRKLRPTLFDLLAHRALDFFKNDALDVTRPAEAFEITQALAFAPSKDFIEVKFTSTDSFSRYTRALTIFQQLESFHLRQKNANALADVTIERLQFVEQFSVRSDKDQLYIKALSQIAEENPSSAAAAQALYLQALYHENLGQQYKPHADTSKRFERKFAREICKKVLAHQSTDSLSEGIVNCQNLLTQIEQKQFLFNLEQVNLPGQPFRFLLNYRNIPTLYARIIKADENTKQFLENPYDNQYWPTLLAASPVQSWQQDLPQTDDYQEHSVELKAGPLPSGEYFLITGSEKNFNNKSAMLGARFFQVSSISYINSGSEFFVLDRDKGFPLPAAKVQLLTRRYDPKSRKYLKEKAGLYTTDANGFFKIPSQQDPIIDNGYLLDISYGADRLSQDNEFARTYYNNPEEQDQPEARINAWLFTDRGIYRPGQTLFFKGIVTAMENNERPLVRAGYNSSVYLNNAQGELIDSLAITTNEFGSFSGKFQLPQGTLNGNFSLSMSRQEGTANIQVEEYKRPSFLVTYGNINGSYAVSDTISITGTAKAYAGNNIGQARVKYRVIRQARFVYPWLLKRFWQPPVQELEITHGETTTGPDGIFTVKFQAIPDLTIDKQLDPVFDYKIFADVTDPAGETRSAETIVSAGYKSVLLSMDIPSQIPADSLHSIFVRTENLNGQFLPSEVTVKITRLQTENRLIRERYWQRPDQFVMTRDEYIRSFPNDEYDNETDPSGWTKEETIYEKTDSTTTTGSWPIATHHFKPGSYLVESRAKDKEGREIKNEKYITLYDTQATALETPQYLWAEPAAAVEPGEKTAIRLGTAADKLFVIRQTDRQNASADTQKIKAYSYDFFQLNNEKKTFPVLATEADRGGFQITFLFVRNNRFYQSVQTVDIPWSNKDLHVEFKSFRDHTLPGSKEKWGLKISGFKNEKVAAEMLASMYDASLDQFLPFQWQEPDWWQPNRFNHSWSGMTNFGTLLSMQKWPEEFSNKFFRKEYDQLMNTSYSSMQKLQLRALAGKVSFKSRSAPESYEMNDIVVNSINLDSSKQPVNKNAPAPPNSTGAAAGMQVRKNFNETAFFFPDLRTDSSGSIEFSFTMPEALTKWKFQSLTHTKDLSFNLSSREIITQKNLMVQPNIPRFLREGDRVELTARIVNLSDKEITGQAELQLFNAETNESVDGWFQNMFAHQYFTVAAGGSEPVSFPVQVPYLFNKALTWRIIAATKSQSSSETLSDGEEASIPVLTNKILLTESFPFDMRGKDRKDLKIDKLIHAGESESLQQHSLTIEYSSNPAWYAVQALPFLMEYPYDCVEQTWNRYYANSLASNIANTAPGIKEIFRQWKGNDTAALLSNLQKNPDLKSVLLQETPWVLDAKSEQAQKKNIALLFDLIRMGSELNSSLDKLKQLQLDNGGFAWFKGGPDDRYMTQYILTGMGHLKKLKAFAPNQEEKIKPMLTKALPYLDLRLVEEYKIRMKQKAGRDNYIPGSADIQFMYMRSFFPEYPLTPATQRALTFFTTRAKKTWTRQNKFEQGMLALFFYRSGDKQTAAQIILSLKETAINNEELGMYWKHPNNSWYWQDAPIETHSLLIEAFSEIEQNPNTILALKTWLLKNKQTNNWRTTRATAEACFALLMTGKSLITSAGPGIAVQLGNTVIKSADQPLEAGTGYFRKTITGEKINPAMGNITITKAPTVNAVNNSTGENNATGWGAVYWQYFENLDKITPASTPLKVSKKLFIEENTARGPLLKPLNDGDAVKLGDKIKVRIELRVDRDMEYVQMKDMRASALEPKDVISGYYWQGGLGYYQTARDASTQFFFNNLLKGTYVFEYTLFATQKGNFSNGITDLQCMYAPEFGSHSEGIRLNVER